MEDKSGNSISLTNATTSTSGKDDAGASINEMGLTFSKPEDEKGIVVKDGDGDFDDPHVHSDLHDHLHDHDDHDDLDQNGEPKGPLTCREKLRDFLHTQTFQIVVIVLVVLDCIFVIGELVLDYEALAEAKNCNREALPTTAAAGNVSDRHRREVEAEHPTSEEEEHEESATAKAAEALHILSLIILSVFMIELTLKLIALGVKFFHSKLEVFDAIVIIVSFVLDIITLVFPDNFAVVDLIVVLRLWRILRIVNGVILSVEQRAEKQIKHQKRVRMRAVQAAMKLEEYSTALEEEIKILRDMLGKCGVKIDEELFKSKPEKPHYGRKYHTDDENGHHHGIHLHLPHPHLPHLHHRHHHDDDPHHDGDPHHGDPHHGNPAQSGDATESLQQPDAGKPPDYEALHHANQEASC